MVALRIGRLTRRSLPMPAQNSALPAEGDASAHAVNADSPARRASRLAAHQPQDSRELVLQLPAKSDICQVGSLLQKIVCGSPVRYDDDEEVMRHAAQARVAATSASLQATEALSEARSLRNEVERLREHLHRSQVQSTLAIKDSAEEARADLHEVCVCLRAAASLSLSGYMYM